MHAGQVAACRSKNFCCISCSLCKIAQHTYVYGAVHLIRATAKAASMFQHHQLRGTHTCAPPLVRHHCRLLSTAAKRSSEMQKIPVVLPGGIAGVPGVACVETVPVVAAACAPSWQCCNMLSSVAVLQGRRRIR